jgi:aryl-alcohol dehydrogenase-like predicted oxidoreductase
MKYRNLGRSGLQVSVVGIGGNRFGVDKMPQEEVNRVIAGAQDLGINFIDSANVYAKGRSEETLGVALKGRWDCFVVATKFFVPMTYPQPCGPNQGGASRYHMMNAVEDSLRRLQSDHIDVYYVHSWDENTPIEETMRGLDDLVRAGKVRYVAASNFFAYQLAHANLLATVRGWTPFIAIQNEFNMLERVQELEMLPYCAEHKVGFVPYSPLHGGLLTGKYKRGVPYPAGSRYDDFTKQGRQLPYNPEKHFDRIEALEAWATAHGHALTELALAWLIAKPQIASVISGVTNLDQLKSNVQACEWELSKTELEEVNKILAA